MTMMTYDESLRDAPLGFRMPCKGCAWLKNDPEQPSGYRYYCAYTLPPEIAGWRLLPSMGVYAALTTVSKTPGLGRYFTDKMIDGPFADDANEIGCSVRK